MLTDIFSNRYLTVALWDDLGESERRLLVQGFRILSEQLRPYYVDKQEHAGGKAFWTDVQQRLSMELGLPSLAPLFYGYTDTTTNRFVSGFWDMHKVCDDWMFADLTDRQTPDQYIKDRVSLIELGFRKCGDDIAASNATLATAVENARDRRARTTARIVLPGDPAEHIIINNRRANESYRESVVELNSRLRQSGSGLQYHNGFIQRADDELAEQEIKKPFWAVVTDQKWKNVDYDMKEAVDRRDTGAKDAAFYAARALESTVKIISEDKKLTTGSEKGAANYLDNLRRGKLIEVWELDALKLFFAKVRNPMSHGATTELSVLRPAQVDWAIETCMSWIKNLVRRA